MSTAYWGAGLVQGVRTQVRFLARWWLWETLFVLAIVGFLLYLNKFVHIPISVLVQDPASTMGAPFYIGFVSNLGVLFWNAAAVVCFFSAYLLYVIQQDREFAGFFLWSGLITTLLLVDDFFMLHDAVLYIYFQLNENIVFLAYVVIVAVYLVRYRSTLQKTSALILALALGFFVLSTIADKIPGGLTKLGLAVALDDDMLFLAEEGAKLFAIANWLLYYLSVAAQRLRAAFAER